MSNELKPCPFCGGKAYGPIFSSMCASGSKEIYAVECPKCCIDLEGEQRASTEAAKASAISAWNTRA
jgi:Lar family restriction alleviation protein